MRSQKFFFVSVPVSEEAAGCADVALVVSDVALAGAGFCGVAGAAVERLFSIVCSSPAVNGNCLVPRQ